jgi:hypothetical protein
VTSKHLPLAPALLSLLLTSCGDGGSTTPTTAKFAGYWLNEDSDKRFTVFGFESGEDAPWELPLEENMVSAGGKPVSAVYLADDVVNVPDLVQLATWELSGEDIIQTVLADQNEVPGKQYSTHIYAFHEGESMELESKNDPSGKRSYSYHPTCPITNHMGWTGFSGYDCPAAISFGTSLAVDARGEVHTLSTPGGMGGTGCDPLPTISELTRGCIPRLALTEPFLTSASTIASDDVWRVVKLSMDGTLRLAERPVRGTTWSEKMIDPSPQEGGAMRALRMFETAAGRIILSANTDGRIFLWRGPDYTRETPTFPEGSNQAHPLIDATVDAKGKLVLMTENAILQETESGWNTLPFQASGDFGGTVRVVGGAIHAAWIGGLLSSAGIVGAGAGVYGVWDGAAWTKTELGPLMFPMIVTREGGPIEVIAVEGKAELPAIFHLSIDEKGKLSAAFLTEDPTLGSGTGSLASWIHPMAVRGPEGTLAVTLDGQRTYVYSAHRVPARDARVHIKFTGEGTGKVRSLDGRVDCSSDCDLTVPQGTRLPLVFEAEPGSTVSAYSICVPSYRARYGYCYLDARDADNSLTVTRRPTAVRSELSIGSGTNSGADRFGLFGSKIAVGAVFLQGVTTLPIGGDPFDTGMPGPTVGLGVDDRATHVGWARALPSAALAVAPADDGGAWAVLAPQGPITLDGTQYGMAGDQTPMLVRFDGNAKVMKVTPLGAGPSPSLFTLAAAVAHDGTAVALVSSGAPLGGLGLPDLSAALWHEPGGALHAAGLGKVSWSGAGAAALDGDRAVLVGGDPSALHVVALKAGAVTGQHAIPGATALGAAVHGTRFLAALSAFGSVDLGAGPRQDGQAYVVEYDAGGAYQGGAALPVASPYYGLRALDSGAIVVAGSTAQRLGKGLALGSAVALPSPTGQLMPGSQGLGDEGVGAILLGGSGDMDFQSMSAGGFVLVDFVPGP